MPTTQQQVVKLITTVHGLMLHSDRSLEFNGRTYPGDAGFFGFELLDGVRLFKAPGRNTLIFSSHSGKRSAARHIAVNGWFDCTSQLPKAIAMQTVEHRCRRMMRNLFRSHHARVAWVEVSAATNPYRADVTLNDDGTVLVASQPLCPGSNAKLANGYIVSHSGRFEVTVSDEDGVRDRVRYDIQVKKWRRLVVLGPVPMSPQKNGLTYSPDGRLVFAWTGIPPIVIERGVPFEMHLSAVRSLVRLSADFSLLDWDAQRKRLIEYVYVDSRWWWVAGSPRDEWIWQEVGCPSQGRVGSLEVMPGIVVRSGGVVEVLGRSYVNGEAVDVALPGTRIYRAADVNAWLFVQTATTIVAFFFGVDGEWYKAAPHAVDLPFRSWRHHGANGNAIRWLVEKVEEIASDAPIAPIFRFVAFAQRHLGPLGTLVLLYVGTFCLVVGVPLGIMSRLARHVKRVLAVSQ